VAQLHERTGFSDTHVREAAESLVASGKAISFRTTGGPRYSRADAPDHLTRTALKSKGVRLRRTDLEILNWLESLGRPATPKEISEVTGIGYVGACLELRRLTALGLVARDVDPSDRKGIRLLYSLRSKDHPYAR